MALPKSIFYFFTVLILGLSACSNEDDSIQDQNENAISVEAYIYANEPVAYIKLSKIEGNGNAQGIALQDADVSIAQGNSDLQFVHSDTEPGHYYQVDSMQTITEHSDLVLHIMNEGMAFALPTQIPPQITGLTISSETITLTPNNLDSIMATISWDAIEGYSYCIFIRNMEYGSFPVNYLDGQTIESGAFYSLHHTNEVQLRCRDFSHYGTYDLYVTAVTDDYANFYSNPMAQPFVENTTGQAPSWGIFTAFNGRAKNIQVN